MNGYSNTNEHKSNKNKTEKNNTEKNNKNIKDSKESSTFSIDNLYYEDEDIERGIQINYTPETKVYTSTSNNDTNSTYNPLPTYPTTYGPIHLYTEYAYELLVGTRLATED